MDVKNLESKFVRLGARARCRNVGRPDWSWRPGLFRIDIGSDRRGEFFDIRASADADVSVLDVQPRDRHLLMMVRHPASRPREPEQKEKILCGHDERHWFAAGIPATAPVGTVAAAKEALKPDLVRQLESGIRGKRDRRNRRKTATFVRQGEWFFIPEPNLVVDRSVVLRNEPLRRGAGKPHHCEQLYRLHGTLVYVSHEYPDGLTESEHRELTRRRPEAARYGWGVMLRNPSVYVRGRVTHKDHATIRLDDWHRVLMNTEGQTNSASVAFLD